MLKLNNKFVLYGIIGILVIVCGIYIFRAFDLGAKYSAAKTAYEVYRGLAKQDHEKMTKIIGEMTEEIKQRDSVIAGLEGKVKATEAALGFHGKTLAELQRAATSIVDKDQLIFNLRSQVSELTKMYSLAQGVIELQRQEIDQWRGKFDAQVKISEAWKQDYKNENNLRLMAEQINETLEWKLKWARLRGRTTLVAVVGGVAFAYLTYHSVKK